jgi:hypothetical protein
MAGLDRGDIAGGDDQGERDPGTEGRGESGRLQGVAVGDERRQSQDRRVTLHKGPGLPIASPGSCSARTGRPGIPISDDGPGTEERPRDTGGDEPEDDQ